MKAIPVIAAIAAFIGFAMFADFNPDNEIASFGATVIGCGLAFAAYRLFGGE